MRSAPPEFAIRPGIRVAAVAAAVLLAAGCGAPGPLIPAQQERARGQAPVAPAPESYRVSPGDTLYSIAFDYGLDWRRVAAWNRIEAPYMIHVDDRIRLRPPPDMRAAAADPGRARSPAQAARADRDDPPDVNPDPRPAAVDDGGAAAGNAAPSRAPVPVVKASDTAPASPTPAGAVPDAESRSVAGVAWRWPTEGRIARRFEPSATRKGILIAGESGQPIRAAAGGEIVYSGNGLIGYGELVIIKHSERMLSAYAHNRERLVSEGQRVGAGEVIGRMGRNERNENVLHFEIRRNGKPDDPLDYLPRR